MARRLRSPLLMNRPNVLIAIEDFPITEHLQKCLEPFLRKNPAPTIHLFHALGPLPPRLLESPGAEDPAEEQSVEARQEREQEHWLARARANAEPLLQSAAAAIRGFHTPAPEIRTHFQLLNQRADLIDEILKAAREHGCGSIVVGHRSHPWLRGQLHTRTGVRLKSAAPELSVCVVDV